LLSHRSGFQLQTLSFSRGCVCNFGPLFPCMMHPTFVSKSIFGIKCIAQQYSSRNSKH
jgi:hypothetical protein